MKWFFGISKRRLKKKCFPTYHDGAGYTFEMWNLFMQELLKLKVGDQVFNCYTGNWDKVKKINLGKTSIQGCRGSFFGDPVIQTDTNYCLCDESMLGKEKFQMIRKHAWWNGASWED